MTQDPLVHHGRHFGRAVHAFCNVQTLIVNGLMVMGDDDDEAVHFRSAIEHKEYAVFREILRMVPGLEARLMGSSEGEVTNIADLIQRGANGARADDTKGMKSFNHEHTGALLCPAGLDWANTEYVSDFLATPIHQNETCQCPIQVAGNQWPVFLYANYMYDPEDPWNGLLHSGLLAFKHIFTSPSSVEQEPKATRSGNARIHGMRSVTKASLAYVATQDHVTDSERFYNSILELLDDIDEKDEVEQLLTWWNCQVFPLYSDIERLPSQNSAFARIRQKCAEYKERDVNGIRC
ncbi:hypothetical protein BU15DRAFT_88319 [Melanogaster broomeanus]|nr:hypothetical protein BU15DRAFT_88319 [Melanogaster broomeanus]